MGFDRTERATCWWIESFRLLGGELGAAYLVQAVARRSPRLIPGLATARPTGPSKGGRIRARYFAGRRWVICSAGRTLEGDARRTVNWAPIEPVRSFDRLRSYVMSKDTKPVAPDALAHLTDAEFISHWRAIVGEPPSIMLESRAEMISILDEGMPGARLRLNERVPCSPANDPYEAENRTATGAGTEVRVHPATPQSRHRGGVQSNDRVTTGVSSRWWWRRW